MTLTPVDPMEDVDNPELVAGAKCPRCGAARAVERSAGAGHKLRTLHRCLACEHSWEP